MLEVNIIEKCLAKKSKYILLSKELGEDKDVTITILNTETSEEMTIKVEHLVTLIHIIKHLP
jgi:hypothetical protein